MRDKQRDKGSVIGFSPNAGGPVVAEILVH